MSYHNIMVANRAAFSLLELLVVVSIIAVLAGLLLPAVRIVKQVADQMRCASDMRQAGIFLFQYAAENDGRLPGAAQSTGSLSWNSIINMEMLSDEAVKMPRWDAPGPHELGCHSFNPPAGTYRRGWALNWEAWNETNGLAFIPPSTRSLEYASYVSYRLGALIDRFTKKPVKLLLADVHQGADMIYGLSNLVYRHQGTRYTNVLFVDGHVQGVPNPASSTAVKFPLN